MFGFPALLVVQGCLDRSPMRAREEALRQDLLVFRSTLEQYRSDKGTYPGSLNDLVTEGYLRSIPFDPMTRSRDTWRAIYEYPGTPGPGRSSRFVVVGVRSGSPGRARDGTLYGDW